MDVEPLLVFERATPSFTCDALASLLGKEGIKTTYERGEAQPWYATWLNCAPTELQLLASAPPSGTLLGSYDRPADLVAAARGIAADIRAWMGRDVLVGVSACGVDVGAGLRHTGGERSLYEEVLRSFVRDAHEKRNRMQAFLEEGSWEDYGILAHSLKGSARTIGAEDLGELAYAQERAASDRRVDDLQARHQTLMASYDSLAVSLAACLGEDVPEAEPPAADGVMTDEARERMREALACLSTFEVERSQQLLAGLDVAGLADVLDDLNNFDVESAERRLLALVG